MYTFPSSFIFGVIDYVSSYFDTIFDYVTIKDKKHKLTT